MTAIPRPASRPSQAKLHPVTFFRQTIFVVDYNGEPFVPMRPIFTNMGMDWSNQFRKLMKDREIWCVAVLATHDSSGRKQEMICIPLDKLAGFFSTLRPSMVKPCLREKVKRYVAECHTALDDYWRKGVARNPRSSGCPARSAEAAPKAKAAPASTLRQVTLEEQLASLSPAAILKLATTAATSYRLAAALAELATMAQEQGDRLKATERSKLGLDRLPSYPYSGMSPSQWSAVNRICDEWERVLSGKSEVPELTRLQGLTYRGRTSPAEIRALKMKGYGDEEIAVLANTNVPTVRAYIGQSFAETRR